MGPQEQVTPVDLDMTPRRIVMPQAKELDDKLLTGLELVKQVYEEALVSMARSQKNHMGALDAEQIKCVKDIAVTLMDIEKNERDRKRSDKFSGKLDGMSEEELWSIINKK